MKNTQINGETFVSAVDVADWLIQGNDLFMETGREDLAKALEEISQGLRDWATDPIRKVGVPNMKFNIERPRGNAKSN